LIFFFFFKKKIAINVNPGDTKALFRRGQAYENVGKIDEAFDDMKKVCELEKSNKGNLYNIKSKIIFEKIII